MGKGGTVLGLIGIILGAGAIGFAFFVWNGQNTTNSALNSAIDDLTNQLNNMTLPTNITSSPDLTDEFNNLTNAYNNLTNAFNNLTGEFNNLNQTKLVGVWDGLTTNRDYSGFDQLHTWLFEFTDNDFNDSDYISVSLTNTRITLLKPGWYRIHLSALLSGLEPYSGSDQRYFISLLKDHTFDEYLYGVWRTTTSTQYQYFASSMTVYSDGTNYIEIKGSSSPLDSFNIYNNEMYNRFLIEFIST